MSAEKVAKSIKLLDDNVGKFDWLPANWRELIDLDRLDMNSTNNCILGQLYHKVHPISNGYCDAYDAMSGKGIDPDDYCFATSTYDWIEQIKEGLKANDDFKPGTVWYSGKNTRTVLSVHTVGGAEWVTYSWASPMGNGVRLLEKSQFLASKYGIEKPIRFAKGDKLKSADGTYFYYFTDDKVIKLSATRLGWADLAHFEGEHGKMELIPYGAGRHYFSGEFFWNE